MKAAIITVYNSENCGSYWQARALMEFLKSNGFEVSFIKRGSKFSSHGLYGLIRKIGSNIKSGTVRDLPLRIKGVIEQYRVYEKCTSDFIVEDKADEQFDICILGSDTIWNLQNRHFVAYRELYWGHTSHAKKTVSYAASIANTSPEDINRYPEVISYLNALQSIGVRDEYSYNTLLSFANKDMHIVCDPTLLFEKEFYINCIGGVKPRKSNFVFVYYFGAVPKVLQDEIREFSIANNYQIVVMGNSMIGDANIYSSSPSEFINCFSTCSFVVTNTFHGTIFSLLFEKQAVFNSDGKKKVRDLLCRFDVINQDYHENANKRIFAKDNIDYSKVTPEIHKFRDSSISYLTEAIQ